MDGQGVYLHHPSSSTSSAIDLTGTPTGLASSAPPSPSLDPSESPSAFPRRRLSWARVDAGQDPLRFDLSTFDQDEVFSRDTYNIPSRTQADPFVTPSDEHNFDYTNTDQNFREVPGNDYATSQRAPSTVSLIHQGSDGTREDDEAHLTSNMSHMANGDEWSTHDDPERIAGATPRSKRRTIHYGANPSPLQKTGTAIKNVSQNLRRMSLRVVNLAGAGLENQVRLDDEDGDNQHVLKNRDSGQGETGEPMDLRNNMRLRGRTLGFMGPDNKLRLALLDLLVYP